MKTNTIKISRLIQLILLFLVLFYGCSDEAPKRSVCTDYFNFNSESFDYFFDYENTDTLKYVYFENSSVIDTLEFVKIETKTDSLVLNSSNPDYGECQEQINIVQRRYYEYVDSETGKRFRVQIWAESSGGLFDASMYINFQDLYFVNLIGQLSIGDFNGAHSYGSLKLDGKQYQHVWNKFSAGTDFNLLTNRSFGLRDIEAADCFYNKEFGALKLDFGDGTHLQILN